VHRNEERGLFQHRLRAGRVRLHPLPRQERVLQGPQQKRRQGDRRLGRIELRRGTIIQWTDTGAQNQHWRWVAVGDGSYEIVNQTSGQLLDVTSGSTADGATIIQQPDNNGASQHWTLVANGNGYYKIKNVNSGKLLATSTANAQLVQTTDTNADSQLWQAVNVD